MSNDQQKQFPSGWIHDPVTDLWSRENMEGYYRSLAGMLFRVDEPPTDDDPTSRREINFDNTVRFARDLNMHGRYAEDASFELLLTDEDEQFLKKLRIILKAS